MGLQCGCGGRNRVAVEGVGRSGWDVGQIKISRTSTQKLGGPS